MDPRLVLAEESNKRLATTLQHYRNWAGQLLAWYQMANPDASRPPRRIYVGGLPAGTIEVSPSLLYYLFDKTFMILMSSLFVLMPNSSALCPLKLFLACINASACWAFSQASPYKLPSFGRSD